MALTLRPYQQSIITETRQHLLAGTRSVLIQAPTGAGKTALTAHMLGTASSRGRRCWFVVHRRELVKQSCKAFVNAAVPHGVISAGFPTDPRMPVQVCSVQTIARRLRTVAAPDLIVWDECHHVVAGSWSKIHNNYSKATHIGLTATPERTDGAGLGDHFDVMVQGPTTAELIETGFLSPYVYFAPRRAKLDALQIRGGDFDRKQSAKAMDRPGITGDAVSHYLRTCRGKRAVCFAVNRDHSRHVADRFCAAGIPAEHVDGDTPTTQRDAALERFDAGETLVLTNVDLFGEGFDLPAIEAAILLRPTQSLALYLQQVGRALRTHPGKERAVILDHAGNVERFGLPDDDRQWSLEGEKRSKRKKEAVPSVRICPECFAALPGFKPICPDCGHKFVAQVREVEEVAGELDEITPEERARMRRQRNREQAQATTLDELIELGRSRGYKNPAGWARHIHNARTRRATA